MAVKSPGTNYQLEGSGMANISFEPITPKLGAYVRVTADEILDPGVPQKALNALNQYGVLVFPQINLSDDQMIGFTNQLGDMEAVRNTADGTVPSGKNIYRVALDKQDKSQREYVEGNDFWHMDGTSYKVPGKATLLKCERPPSSGGDTGFAHLYAAYEAMPDQRKQQLAQLRVVHCLESVGRRLYKDPTTDDFQRWNSTFPPTEHPLVWKQRSGRSSMVIGATAFDVVGMPHDKGYSFLQELADWSTQEQFTYRHHWQKGDFVIWNNPAMLHRSFPYNEASGRLMHRTTIKGSEEII
jgi:alpha-ketoglutarate-dependent taurine dioxygenase